MICQLCGREGEPRYFEEHHLFPVRTRRKDHTTILVCRQCGDQVHLMFTNQQLQQGLNTLEELKSAMWKYLDWVKDKPIDSHFSVAKKKRKY